MPRKWGEMMEIFEADVPFIDPDDFRSKQKLATGFASPAEDYFRRRLNINDWVVQNKTATFFMRVEGQNMSAFQIHDGDILVIDRSLSPRPNCLAVVGVNGELIVRQLIREGKRWALKHNSSQEWIVEAHGFFVWGVISFVIHDCKL